MLSMPSFQQIATSAVHQSSEPQQPFASTDTRSLQIANAGSEMEVLHSDTVADSNYASAIEMSTAAFSLLQKSDTRTPVAPTIAMQSAADNTAESKWKRVDKKQSKRPRISLTEKVTISNTSESFKPGPTQCPKIVVVKPESSSCISSVVERLKHCSNTQIIENEMQRCRPEEATANLLTPAIKCLGGCCLAFAGGNIPKKDSSKLDRILDMFNTAARLFGQEPDADPEENFIEDPYDLTLSDLHDKTLKPVRQRSRRYNLNKFKTGESFKISLTTRSFRSAAWRWPKEMQFVTADANLGLWTCGSATDLNANIKEQTCPPD